MDSAYGGSLRYFECLTSIFEQRRRCDSLRRKWWTCDSVRFPRLVSGGRQHGAMCAMRATRATPHPPRWGLYPDSSFFTFGPGSSDFGWGASPAEAECEFWAESHDMAYTLDNYSGVWCHILEYFFWNSFVGIILVVGLWFWYRSTFNVDVPMSQNHWNNKDLRVVSDLPAPVENFWNLDFGCWNFMPSRTKGV